MTVILRDSSKVDSVTIHTTEGSSTAINMTDFSSGILMVTTDPGNVTVYVCDTEDGTYLELKKATGSALDALDTGTGNVAIPFPDEMFAAHFVKLKAADTIVTNAVVLLKG